MVDLPEMQLKELILQKGLTLATAESCTGGLLSHRITEIAGSSAYFLGGVTAYAYEAKEQLLQVKHDTLVNYGAVSEETVLEMANGVRKVLSADIGVSVSGIAGPGGGLPNKPVGTVWFGVSAAEQSWAKVFHFQGNRSGIKQQSASAAMLAVINYLKVGQPW